MDPFHSHHFMAASALSYLLASVAISSLDDHKSYTRFMQQLSIRSQVGLQLEYELCIWRLDGVSHREDRPS